jgi:hypothetical protein
MQLVLLLSLCWTLLAHRYERSKDRTQRGSSVVQRHVAMQDEVDIAEGKGRLVRFALLLSYLGHGMC